MASNNKASRFFHNDKAQSDTRIQNRSDPPQSPDNSVAHLAETFDANLTLQGNGAVQAIATSPAHGGAQNSRFFRESSDRYDSRHNNRFNSPQENNRSGRNFPKPSPRYPGDRGGFRNSNTWISPETQHMQEFLIIRNSMRRLFKNSEVAKWKYQDYIAHEESKVAAKKELLAAQVKQKEEERYFGPPGVDESSLATLERLLPDGNHSMIGSRSRVLGEKTCWCKDWQADKEEISPWPSLAELKWEGDDRAKTGVGRYPPLPREMGAPGIPWNQLQAVEQYPLDQVARIPTMEDVYLPVDEIDDDVKYDLINKDLEEAMDKYLES